MYLIHYLLDISIWQERWSAASEKYAAHRQLSASRISRVPDFLAQSVDIGWNMRFYTRVGIKIAVRTTVAAERYVQIDADFLHQCEYTTLKFTARFSGIIRQVQARLLGAGL